MQRAGQLKDVKTWEQFERALRDAETALRSMPVPAPSQKPPGQETGNPRKRASSSSASGWKGKKQDRKASTPQNTSPTAQAKSDGSTTTPQSNPKLKQRGY